MTNLCLIFAHTLGARDFSSAVSGFGCTVIMPNKKPPILRFVVV